MLTDSTFLSSLPPFYVRGEIEQSRDSGREGETLFRFHLNLDVLVDGDGGEWQQWRRK